MNRREMFQERPVLETVLKFAIPSIIGQVILAIYNIADTFFVSMIGSDILITAVSICSPLLLILSAIANLFGIGGSSLMARYLGVHDHKHARRTSSYSFWMCFAFTLVYCLAIFIFAKPLLKLVGGSNPEVLEYATQYVYITVCLGGLCSSLSILISQLLRAEGRSISASLGLTIGGVLNIILDPLFLFVICPENGIIGCAIATALSNLVSLVYYLFKCNGKKESKIISFNLSKEIFDKKIAKNVIRVGIPACLMTLFENLSFAVLDGLMAFNGTAAQAGLGVAKKVNMLAHCIVRGMTQGVLPIIAYNYADGKRQRMRSVVFTSAGISLGISVVCMLCGVFLSQPIIGLFIQHGSDSLSYGSRFLKILAFGAPFSAIAYSVISFFQATNKSVRSTILALLRKGILDIPLMFILRGLIPVSGIVFATPLADILCFIVALILFISYIKYHSNDKVVEHYQDSNIIKEGN